MGGTIPSHQRHHVAGCGPAQSSRGLPKHQCPRGQDICHPHPEQGHRPLRIDGRGSHGIGEAVGGALDGVTAPFDRDQPQRPSVKRGRTSTEALRRTQDRGLDLRFQTADLADGEHLLFDRTDRTGRLARQEHHYHHQSNRPRWPAASAPASAGPGHGGQATPGPSQLRVAARDSGRALTDD